MIQIIRGVNALSKKKQSRQIVDVSQPLRRDSSRGGPFLFFSDYFLSF